MVPLAAGVLLSASFCFNFLKCLAGFVESVVASVAGVELGDVAVSVVDVELEEAVSDAAELPLEADSLV